VDHPTVIRDGTDTGTAGSSVAVYLSPSSTATVLDGFTISATTLGAGIGATALMVSLPPAGVPGATVRKNVLQCGGAQGIFHATCIDLGTSGGALVVEDNALHLGTASSADGTAWGIRDQGVPVSLQVVGNLFEGGSGRNVVAVQTASGTTAVIRNNVIVAPDGATGVEDGAGAEISNNTIVAGTGTAIRTEVSGAAIRNNAIQTTGGACVAQASGDAAPASFRNNDLWGCGAGAAGNLSVDPELDAANGYRPLSTSPLLGAGEDLSALFRTDKDGVARDAPWSIGAYERALP
jgi:hypothetical protein